MEFLEYLQTEVEASIYEILVQLVNKTSEKLKVFLLSGPTTSEEK